MTNSGSASEPPASKKGSAGRPGRRRPLGSRAAGGPARQTATYLRQRLAAYGLQPDTRHGQNFLIDLNLLDLLLDAAELGSHDLVLEVGTGTGSLTSRLAERAGHVLTVEIDGLLAELAAETLAGTDNVTSLQQDVLKNKNRIAPEVLAAVTDLLTGGELTQLKLVANLPYNIATPLISNLLGEGRCPDRMVITIQKEVADRILARPGTKDYGSLSVWVQSLARVRLIRVLPPEVFWPRPKVDSAILQIDPDPQLRQELADLEFFHRLLRALFFHRRKYFRSVLLSATKGILEKPQIDQLLDEEQIEGSVRAEQLDVPTLQRVIEAVRQKVARGAD